MDQVATQVPGPQGMDLAPDGTLYVGSHTFAQVFRFNYPNPLPAGSWDTQPRPVNVRVAPDGNLLVNLTTSTDGVVKFNPATGQRLGQFVPMNGIFDFRFGPDGNLYVGDRTADAPGNPSTPVIRAYNGTSGGAVDLDPSTPAIDGIPLPPLSSLGDFTFAPDGDVLFIQNWDIYRYDMRTHTPSLFAPGDGVGERHPVSMAYGPDGNLYVAMDRNSVDDLGQVYLYNGATGAFIDIFISDEDLETPAELLFVVPEPAGFALLAGAGCIGALRRRRSR